MGKRSMDVSSYAERILFGGDVSDKLFNPPRIIFDSPVRESKACQEQDIRLEPVRNKGLEVSGTQLKFPKVVNFYCDKNKAIALSSFANHELQAIEVMAFALLKFSHISKQQKIEIYQTICEEQKHFQLYCKRIVDLGYQFGDFPLNNFFIKSFSSLGSIDEYYALMALTFETANLDFLIYYRNVFKELGDDKTCEVMDVVYKDEIKHVAIGNSNLTKSILNLKEEKTLWSYYLELLPVQVTPSRSKGKNISIESRLLAGLDQSFIDSCVNYKDEFKVTNRREWKASQN
jgi:uncharacterized ferritin-like protein (DUF455 family)